MLPKKIRIGCGAGFSGDRIEPAILLAEKGNLDYLVLECLAERTIGLAQKRKLENPEKGYDPLLERRLTPLLPLIVANKIRLITNMGAANPLAAARKVVEIARNLGLSLRVVAVTGDDVFEQLDPSSLAMETQQPLNTSGELISANAYIGVEGILEALSFNPDVIITGRVADPSLFLAPMMHEFGWKATDYDLLGKGTVIGHLLECAGQIAGGYFADPIKKPVPDMANLGHPFADVFVDGTAVISKVEGTGGLINLQTVKEQLLYEVINPSAYYTPDVIADFTTVQLKKIAENQVFVSGGGGNPKPETYKVSVGYKAFYLGEGEISYAGQNALERATLAGEIMQERLQNRMNELRVDYVGVNSVHRTNFESTVIPYEVRLRIAGKANSAEDAALIGEEVEALYTNGPAGGGGVKKYVTEIVGIISVLMNRTSIIAQTTLFES